MKKLVAASLLILLNFFLSAQSADFEWDKKISNVSAVVKILEDGQTAVIVPNNNSSMRYISQQLPDEYKKDGLKVTFTGWEGKIPPNVRMIGKPLKLQCICVTKEEQKKFLLKRRSYKFK